MGFTHIGEHGLAVLGDHGRLLAVQADGGVVEGLLGVLQHIVQVRHTPLKDATEVAWDQGPSNGWPHTHNTSNVLAGTEITTYTKQTGID